MARLAGSEPPASPPEPPKEVVPADVVEEPAPMEEDSEGQKASVTRSQSSVRMTFQLIFFSENTDKHKEAFSTLIESLVQMTNFLKLAEFTIQNAYFSRITYF